MGGNAFPLYVLVSKFSNDFEKVAAVLKRKTFYSLLVPVKWENLNPLMQKRTVVYSPVKRRQLQ